MMRERLKPYLIPPVFPADEDKTFTASLLHVILWSLLVGICLFTLIAPIHPHMRLIAWLYVLALGGLTLALMSVMRRGYVQVAAISVNIGLWIILSVAAYFNGGVAAPAYSGYLIVIICTSLLVSWEWGLAMTVASALTGAVFLLAANNNSLPDWQSTYSYSSVWSANVAYFFVATMLLALALRAIKRASQQTRHETAERLKTEQALSHSEQRFRSIFDSVNDAILVQELSDGRILDVNQTMCEMYGYTTEEARHLFVGDLSADYTPYTQKDALAWMQKAAGGEPQIFEWHAKTHDGHLFWVEVNMRLAPIDERDRLLVVVRDITERKRAEEALRASEDRFRSLVQNSQDIITVHERNGIMIYESPSVARVFGYAPGYMIGKDPVEFIPPEDAAYVKRAFEEVVTRRNSGLPTEYRFRRADGTFVYLEALGANLLDHPGVRGIVITSRDVTERKRTDGAVRQYIERLSILHEIDQAILAAKSIEEIADAALSRIQRSVPSWRVKVLLFDFEAGQAVVAAYYSDGTKLAPGERLPLAALGSIVKLRPGELYVISDLSELLDPSLIQLRQIGDGARSSIDAPLIVLGQQIGLLNVDATQWDAFQGEVVDVVREVADQLAVAIQNARLLEQTRRHAHELEQRVAERTRELAAANERLTELDRLKSKFVSDVSHELRTPIANLKLHVELLQHGRADKREHYLGVVKQQSRRLGELVDDILNLSRLEMGRERTVFGPVDLNFVVEQIVAAHQPRAESIGLTLAFGAQRNLAAVRGEVNQLAQVVTNLVINALNYTSEGTIRVSTFQTAAEACLQIEDTGIGIDPDDLPNIFDRFYRGRRWQRRETPGTGLGLAIVKEIVDLHEGRIEVNSQVKQGSTFKVWLPLFHENGAS